MVLAEQVVSEIEKSREERLVDIAREEGRRVGLKEGLARRWEVDYIDRGYGHLEGGAAIEDGDYYSRTTRNRYSPPPRTTTTTAPPIAHGGGDGGKIPGIMDLPEEKVLNPMTVVTPVLIPSLEPFPPTVLQPVPVPTPDPAIPPVLRLLPAWT